MSGRTPRCFKLKRQDVSTLHALVCRGKTEQRVAHRARILLTMHAREPVETVAEQGACDRVTVWRVCRRYEERGLEALYDAPRSGRPRALSPSTAGAPGKSGVQ